MRALVCPVEYEPTLTHPYRGHCRRRTETGTGGPAGRMRRRGGRVLDQEGSVQRRERHLEVTGFRQGSAGVTLRLQSSIFINRHHGILGRFAGCFLVERKLGLLQYIHTVAAALSLIPTLEAIVR